MDHYESAKGIQIDMSRATKEGEKSYLDGKEMDQFKTDLKKLFGKRKTVSAQKVLAILGF